MEKLICLDAGHYGKYNRSAVVPEFYESDFNWKFHLKLKAQLEKYGIKVITTRTEQSRDRGLKDRGRAASGCALFVSIHANASSRESADYPLAIVPIDGSGDGIGLKLAQCIRDVMDTQEPARIWTKKSDSGRNWYGVINGATQVGVTGIILEHSFYSNERIAKWLLDDENLDVLAKAEAAIIAQHYGWEASASVENAYTQEQFIRDVQKAIGAKVDGKAGPETIGKTITVSRYVNRTHSVVVPIQKWLYALGYTEIGEADGRAGPAFEKAVKRYQKDHGRNVDGEITAKNITWRKLLGME